jgi:hypothetical protein
LLDSLGLEPSRCPSDIDYEKTFAKASPSSPKPLGLHRNDHQVERVSARLFNCLVRPHRKANLSDLTTKPSHRRAFKIMRGRAYFCFSVAKLGRLSNPRRDTT